ncbi:MAG: ATP-binding protein, partial [Syntrophobacteraceae bacterium]
LDMSWFARLATHEGLPPGSTFTVIDRKGTILTRYPEPERWVGKAVPDTEIVGIILERGAGVTEALDVDETPKVYAFTPLTGGLQEGFMYAGIPSETVFAKSNYALRRNLVALTGVTLLVLAIGWMFDQVFVLGRIENLIGATRRLAVGEWNARTDLICGRGELGQLACALDVMAENLESREAERDQAQHDLQETLQTLRAIIEASPAAIVALSPSGHVRMWNPAAQHIFDWSEEEANGILMPALPAENGEALRLLREHILSGKTLSGLELPLQRKDGSTLEVSLSAGPLRDAEGNMNGSVAIFLDITECRKAIEALSQARDELEMRVKQRTADLTKLNDELRGEIARREDTEAALRKSAEGLKFFAYSVIHDLKSPAIGMHGLTRLLRKQYGDRLDERGKKYCEQILASSEHFAALIEKINSYIAAKEATLRMEHVNLQEIFRILWDEFALRLRVHEIAWREPPDPIEIKADRISVLRVLRNRVDNSLKYGGDQLTEIRLNHELSDQFHILSVSDNGVGISGENREKIFGIFQRHGAPRGVEGAGLGLAIVKEIAERHGGSAWVESGPEGGTTFRISISKNL